VAIMVFLCVITPVFDECLSSFKLLVTSLQQQSFTDFTHAAISDGPSPEIKSFISSLDDSRFTYLEIPATQGSTRMEMFLSVVARRNFGLQSFEAVRYVFLNAGLKILSNNYFQILFSSHQKHPEKVFLTKVKRAIGCYFPGFPIDCGSLDISNYCFTKKMAKKGYPTDFDKWYPYANDYRFFRELRKSKLILLDLISAEKDGNKTYKNLRDYSL